MESIQNIFCVGRNYVEHVHELGNIVPDEPVIFSKPTHSLVEAKGQTIHLPKDRGIIHYEAELVLKMGRDYSPEMTVDDLVSDMTIGLDLTLRDVQNRLKKEGHPWLMAKGFLHAAILGSFIPFPGIEASKENSFSLHINEERVQVGNMNKMIFSLESIIRHIGEALGLKKNDIIFTGTPEGVGPLKDCDRLLLKWGERTVGDAHIAL